MEDKSIKCVHLEFKISKKHKIIYRLTHLPIAIVLHFLEEMSELTLEKDEWHELKYEQSFLEK